MSLLYSCHKIRLSLGTKLRIFFPVDLPQPNISWPYLTKTYPILFVFLAKSCPWNHFLASDSFILSTFLAFFPNKVEKSKLSLRFESLRNAKYKTDFDPIVEASSDNLTHYIARIEHLCEENTLPKLTDDALKEILTFSSRISEHKNKLWQLLLAPFYQNCDIVHSTIPIFFSFWRKPYVLTIKGDFTIEKKRYRWPYKKAIKKAKAGCKGEQLKRKSGKIWKCSRQQLSLLKSFPFALPLGKRVKISQPLETHNRHREGLRGDN